MTLAARAELAIALSRVKVSAELSQVVALRVTLQSNHRGQRTGVTSQMLD